MSSNEENKKEGHDHHHHDHGHDRGHPGCHRRRYWKIPFIVAIIIAIKSGLVLLLWNALIPDLFNGPQVTYLQAIGLVVLTKLLVGFGGHRLGGPFGRGRFGGHPFDRGRWASLSPEEREKMRDALRDRCRR